MLGTTLSRSTGNRHDLLEIVLALIGAAVAGCAFSGWWIGYTQSGLPGGLALLLAVVLSLLLLGCGVLAHLLHEDTDADMARVATMVAGVLLAGAFTLALLPGEVGGPLAFVAWTARLAPGLAVVLGLALLARGDLDDVDGVLITRRGTRTRWCEQATIRYVRHEGQPWFSVRDIDAALGRAHSRANVLSRVPDEDSRREVRLDPAASATELFVNARGAGDLLSGSRSPLAPRLRTVLGATGDRREFAEPRTIAAIQACFPQYPATRQYPVRAGGQSYYIDLYFPAQRVAVECDERGHTGYDQDAERLREQRLRATLDCQFVRYDPAVDLVDAIIELRRLLAGPTPPAVPA